MPELTRGRRVIRWLVSVPLAALFLVTEMPKLLGAQGWVRHFAAWGYPDWFRLVVGAVEVLSSVLLFIPRLAFFGACGIIVVMAGATYTHLVRASDEAGRAAFTLALLGLAVFVAYARRRWSE